MVWIIKLSAVSKRVSQLYLSIPLFDYKFLVGGYYEPYFL